MSKVKSIKKSIKKDELFQINLINTIYGSLIQSCNIALNLGWDKYKFINKMTNASFPPVNDEKDFIKKVVEAVGIDFEKVKQIPLCVLHSKWNTLFAPYIINEDGEKIPVPILPDHNYPTSFYHLEKIEYINWDREELEQEMR